jgi:hypothetical protein
VHRDESHAVFACERHGGIHVVDNSHRDAIGGVDGVGHLPVQHTCSEVHNRPDAKATELGRRHVADVLHREVHVMSN